MEFINNQLEMIYQNKYTSSILGLFLVLYGGLAAPKLPSIIQKLFDNKIFRIIILSLIVYTSQKDTRISIMLAVVFIMSIDLLRNKKMFENFSNHSSINNDSCPKSCDVIKKLGYYFDNVVPKIKLILSTLEKPEGISLTQHNSFVSNIEDQLLLITEIGEKEPFNSDIFKNLKFLNNTIISRLDLEIESHKLLKSEILDTNRIIDCHIKHIESNNLCGNENVSSETYSGIQDETVSSETYSGIQDEIISGETYSGIKDEIISGEIDSDNDDLESVDIMDFEVDDNMII